MTAEDGRRGTAVTCDGSWKTVPQTSSSRRKCSVTDSGQSGALNILRQWRDERSHLASVYMVCTFV